ncbi:MAG: protein-export chaperone SecB [Alphaproteobacteria bacterium]|nr:protein-export chaperone SecB [Alphaproteobacteria bacterium]
MSEEDLSATNPATEENGEVVLLTQYVKDLSFESPNAPSIFQVKEDQKPQINVNVSVRVNHVGPEGYETVMTINVEAKSGDTLAFLVELEYGTLWGIRGVPEEHLPPLLLVECPRLMFPFARRVLADTIRDGGFPPVLLEPVDFAALYRAQHRPEGVKPN